MSEVKYPYKNVYTGPGRALIELNAEAPVDEIRAYADGRYFSAQEACWRVLQFDLHGYFPNVQRLHIHLKGDQIARSHEHDAPQDAATRPRREATLTPRFRTNTENLEIEHGK